MKRVIIADDHPAFCEGIAKILVTSGYFDVIAMVSDGLSLVETVREKRCDIVITDIVMPRLDGIKAMHAIKKEFPDLKVVLLTMHGDRSFFDDAVKAGADGYILKDDPPETVLLIMKAVMEGYKSFTPRMQAVLVDRYQVKANPLDELTARELEVFKLTVRGYKNTEIAEKIGITPRTVLFHKQNIKDKLMVKTNAELVSMALKHNII